jgi:hypothetical protein
LKMRLLLHTWRPKRWSRSHMTITTSLPAFDPWEAWSWLWCLQVFPHDNCLHHLPFLPLMYTIVCSVNRFFIFFRWILRWKRRWAKHFGNFLQIFLYFNVCLN